MRKLSAFVVLLASVSATPLLAAATMMPVVPFPGAKDTLAAALNDKNVLAGTYIDKNGVKHGFVGTLDGTYTSFDFGKSGNTVAIGIDKAGDITGANYGSDMQFCNATPYYRTAKGKATPVKKGTKTMSGLAWGMDAAGDFVGYTCDQTQIVVGYQGKSGKYKNDVKISGTQFAVAPSGINASGMIDGWSVDIGGVAKGFILKGGTTSFVTYPHATQTQLTGLNDAGLATGVWTDASSVQHAFMYDTKTSKFTSLEPKGATTSVAGGVNNKGLIAIYSNKGSFIYCPKACPSAGVAFTAKSVHVPASRFLRYENDTAPIKRGAFQMPRIPFIN